MVSIFPFYFSWIRPVYEQTLRKISFIHNLQKAPRFSNTGRKKQTKISSTILYINSWRTVIQENVSNINNKFGPLPATET